MGGSTRGEGEGGSYGKAEPRRSSTYRDLLETHLLLAAVGFAATVDLQRHDLPVAADVSEDLAAARPDVGHSPRINTHTHARARIPAHLVFEERFHVRRTHGVGMTGAGERRTLAAAARHPRPRPRATAHAHPPGGASSLRPSSPEDVVDAALAEPMSTLGLAGLTQDQPAGLAAVLGFRSLYEVVPEAPVEGQEACGGTCRETPPVSYLGRC